MRQLVVLVGMPGSGKTSFHQKKSDWVVVSKNVIRQSMFGHSFEPEFEDAVDRIFAAALIVDGRIIRQKSYVSTILICCEKNGDRLLSWDN